MAAGRLSRVLQHNPIHKAIHDSGQPGNGATFDSLSPVFDLALDPKWRRDLDLQQRVHRVNILEHLEPLSGIAQLKNPTPASVLRICFIQCVKVLERLHDTCPIFHRDISPESLMWYRKRSSASDRADQIDIVLAVNTFDHIIAPDETSSVIEKLTADQIRGTLPFRAGGLLQSPQGSFHALRYDLESVVNVFTYVAGRFGDPDNGALKDVYKGWISKRLAQIAADKRHYMKEAVTQLRLTPAFDDPPTRFLLIELLMLFQRGYGKASDAEGEYSRLISLFALGGLAPPPDPFDYNTLGGLITARAMLDVEERTRKIPSQEEIQELANRFMLSHMHASVS